MVLLSSLPGGCEEQGEGPAWPQRMTVLRETLTDQPPPPSPPLKNDRGELMRCPGQARCFRWRRQAGPTQDFRGFPLDVWEVLCQLRQAGLTFEEADGRGHRRVTCRLMRQLGPRHQCACLCVQYSDTAVSCGDLTRSRNFRPAHVLAGWSCGLGTGPAPLWAQFCLVTNNPIFLCSLSNQMPARKRVGV